MNESHHDNNTVSFDYPHSTIGSPESTSRSCYESEDAPARRAFDGMDEQPGSSGLTAFATAERDAEVDAGVSEARSAYYPALQDSKRIEISSWSGSFEFIPSLNQLPSSSSSTPGPDYSLTLITTHTSPLSSSYHPASVERVRVYTSTNDTLSDCASFSGSSTYSLVSTSNVPPPGEGAEEQSNTTWFGGGQGVRRRTPKEEDKPKPHQHISSSTEKQRKRVRGEEEPDSLFSDSVSPSETLGPDLSLRAEEPLPVLDESAATTRARARSALRLVGLPAWGGSSKSITSGTLSGEHDRIPAMKGMGMDALGVPTTLDLASPPGSEFTRITSFGDEDVSAAAKWAAEKITEQIDERDEQELKVLFDLLRHNGPPSSHFLHV